MNTRHLKCHKSITFFSSLYCSIQQIDDRLKRETNTNYVRVYDLVSLSHLSASSLYYSLRPIWNIFSDRQSVIPSHSAHTANRRATMSSHRSWALESRHGLRVDRVAAIVSHTESPLSFDTLCSASLLKFLPFIAKIFRCAPACGLALETKMEISFLFFFIKFMVCVLNKWREMIRRRRCVVVVSTARNYENFNTTHSPRCNGSCQTNINLSKLKINFRLAPEMNLCVKIMRQ